MEMVFCFCHTEQWRETIQLINGHVVQEQWNIGNRQSCVEIRIQVRSESLLPILLIVSLYIIMNDEAAILERLNMTVLSFLDIFNIHLVCDKLLWRLANASKWVLERVETQNSSIVCKMSSFQIWDSCFLILDITYKIRRAHLVGAHCVADKMGTFACTRRWRRVGQCACKLQ